MTFKKLSYYLLDVKVTIKCDHAPLCTFLTAHILNSKVNNWGIEIASVCHVTFEQIKGAYNILANSISWPRSLHLYHCLDLEGKGKESGHDIIEKLHPIIAETPAQVEQNATTIHGM